MCVVVLVGPVGSGGCDHVRSEPGSNAGDNRARPATVNYTVLRRTSGAFTFYLSAGGQVTFYDTTADRPLASKNFTGPTLLKFDPSSGLSTGDGQSLTGPQPAGNFRELRLAR